MGKIVITDSQRCRFEQKFFQFIQHTQGDIVINLTPQEERPVFALKYPHELGYSVYLLSGSEDESETDKKKAFLNKANLYRLFLGTRGKKEIVEYLKSYNKTKGKIDTCWIGKAEFHK